MFHCNFDSSWDENFDEWPDRWTRRRGEGFPHYVNIRIHRLPSPAGDRCLRIQLDGGAAAAYSPPVAVGPLFSYVLEGRLKTEGLQHDRAYFSLTFLDCNRRRLETFYSEKVQKTDGWQNIRLGPAAPADDDVRFAVVGLHVQQQSGEDTKEDLKGVAAFDDIWLGHLPRMDLRTNDTYNFFTNSETVEIICTASGFSEKNPEIAFRLEDVFGTVLAEQKERMAEKEQGREKREERREKEENSLLSPHSSPFSPRPSPLALQNEPQQGRIGHARWKPPIPGQGFYRVRVTMAGRQTTAYRRELNLVVVDPCHNHPGSEFGWTLPQGDRPMPLPDLSRLVIQAGINRLKYPLWYDERQDAGFVERLITFNEWLNSHGIELIGMLCTPPPSLREHYGRSNMPVAVDLFSPDPSVWYPSLEPVMARMATKVRWWQLGTDTDTSFVDYPDLAGKISRIKAELDRIGRNVNLGIGWGWMHEAPQSGTDAAPWQYLSLSSDPPMTHSDLAAYLDGAGEVATERWVVVEPISAEHYAPQVRAVDMVRRMIAAKIHGARAVFCPDPFGNNHGLMNDDGTPGELFMPWRTTALALGGAYYLGSIQLPNGSDNHVFVRAGEAVMVVWNEEPTEEVIYLGEQPRQIDLWGRTLTPVKREHRQVISVGRVPSFVTGLSEPIARWRMNFHIDRNRLPSIFGRTHADSLRLKNSFCQGVDGKATLIAPDIWRVEPKQINFWLTAGEQLHRDFQIALPYDTLSGRNPLRVDFQLQAERPYQFSVYRYIDVGLGEVYVGIATKLNDQGELEVRQRFVNHGDRKVSFQCQLFAPERQLLKTRIVGLEPGNDVQTYRLADGKELLGRTLWLRAREISGPRMLNYRFTAEP